MSPDMAQGEALKVVRGLYAGMNLLNELEPLADSNITTISFDEHPSVSLGAPGAVQPPNDAASEASIWTEVRQEFLELTGEILPEPPNFQKFLQQLKPGPTGQLWCPSCQRYRHDQFPPSCIASHFRYHHLDSDVKFVDRIEGKPRIDHLIRSLMKRPESQARKLELYDLCDKQSKKYEDEQRAALEAALHAKTYNKAQLPHVPWFLFLLDASCDGRLLCRHRKCKGLPRFDASIEDIKSHFIDIHCAHLTESSARADRVIIEADLKAEFSLDRIGFLLEPLFAKSKTRKEAWFASTPRRRNMAEHCDRRNNKRNCLIHDYVRKLRQWQVLQELRTEFVRRKRHLLDLISKSGSASLTLLSYRISTDLLDTGILTLKDVISGGSPTSLTEVLAFIVLSYSAATVMRKRRMPSSFSPSALDFAIWRQGVPIPDLLVFDELVGLLWDGSLSEYNEYNSHFISVAGLPSGLADAVCHYNYVATDMLKGFKQHHDFDFTVIDDIFQQGVNSEAYLENPPQGIDWFLEPFPTLSDVPDQAGADHQPLQLDTLGLGGDTSLPEPGTPQEILSFPERLKATAIFAVVIQFVLYISQLGLLLESLAGIHNIPSTSTLGRNASSAVTSSFSRFTGTLISWVIAPLSLDPELLDLRPLITIAGKMIEAGYLISVRTLEDYIIDSIRLFPVSRDVFSSLVKQTLKGCRVAASKVDPDYIGNMDYDGFNDYNQAHIQSRQERQLNAFLNGKPLQSPHESHFESVFNLSAAGPRVNMDMINFASPSEEHIDDDLNTRYLGDNTVVNDDRLRIPASQRDPTSDTSFRMQGANLDIQLSDYPETNEHFNDFITPNGLSTMQSAEQNASTAMQRKICDFPGCKKAFNGIESTNNLRRHKREKHDNRSSWSCPFENCGLVSPRLHNIRQHWVKKHEGVPMPEELMARRAKGGGGLSRKMKAVMTMV